MAVQPMILCENLMKIYKSADLEVIALQGLDLSVNPGEMIAVIGSSGSGKSTLLNIIGGLDSPSAGKITVDGMDLGKFSYWDKIRYKSKTIGFVWQNPARNLIPYLTAVENIETVMQFRHNYDRRRAQELLECVGIGDKAESRLEELSGGEQQRVAIAIGISENPKVLLLDEPTGAVDNATAARILELLRELRRELEMTIVIVTHDTKLAARVDRAVLIRDGRTSSEFVKKSETFNEEQATTVFGNLSHDEFAVLDKTGRLQIPLEILERTGLTGKTKVKLDTDGRIIRIIPQDEA